MENLSCETVVGEKLVAWLNYATEAQVLSFHPPSSKAYASDLIRIPKLNDDGSRSRDRNHIDVVFLTATKLWLVELKCKYSESGDDIQKLRDIKASYSNQELIQFIQNRLTVPLKFNLANVNEVVAAIGVKTMDIEYKHELPVFIVEDGVQLLGWSGEPLASGEYNE